MSLKLMSLKLLSFKTLSHIIIWMSLQKWKGLAEKRRFVEQYYKEKDKAIKDYKFRRDVSSDFYKEGGKISHRKDR